jgi:hypothetical protein
LPAVTDQQKSTRIGWWGVGIVLTATAIRIHNAFAYPLHFGFDAPANWDYIQHLLSSWRLPRPNEGWSTAHPPFFYYVSALLGRVIAGDKQTITIAVRVFSSLVGLAAAGCAVVWVRRVDPGRALRAVIAAALILFLPAHLYMSAMLGEEILSSALISIVVLGVALDLASEEGWGLSVPLVAGLGVVAGFGFLTKLTGVLVMVAACLAWAIAGWKRGAIRDAAVRILLFGSVATVIGGWPYVLNFVQYGYFYPQNLSVHEIMFTMPPGERFATDYLRFPLATFTDPQVLSPDLLHSVWGTTYTTLWYDGHRVMLPRSAPPVENTGTLLLLLGLLPTMAFAIGFTRGVKRALRDPGGADTVFVALVVLTIAGYVMFTWNNPWYATVKASYLLGAAVPFGVYSSEVLADWLTAGNALRRGVVGVLLGALLLGSASVFTVGLVFTKREGPGFEWPRVDPSRHYERVQKTSSAGAALELEP